jgi:hypothetical protein
LAGAAAFRFLFFLRHVRLTPSRLRGIIESSVIPIKEE